MKRAPTQLLYALAAVTLLSQGAAHALRPAGPEFQVNSYTPLPQAGPQVATSETGSFVVIWNSLGQEGTGGLSGLFGRRYDSTGAPLATELHVNNYTLDHQTMAAVSTDASGRFVVAWNSNGQDGDYRGIFAQAFDTSGARVGVEFQVALQTIDIQDQPDVAIGSDGGFFVVWESVQYAYGTEIFARRHDSAGNAQATEFQINTYTEGHQVKPRIAISAPGQFIVIWSSERDGYFGVFGRRLDSSGPQGSEFQVATFFTTTEGYPALAPTGDGGFMVVWQSASDGAATGILGRRFDSMGDPQTDEFLVNEFTVGAQNAVDLASSGSEFVASWVSGDQDGSLGGIFARRLDASGPAGSEFRVNIHTPSAQQRPSVGMDQVGDFVVAWDSDNQDGSNVGVFARRFLHSDPAVLDVDADGTIGPLTDGLLVLRHLFGFTDAALISSAVGPGCLRCGSTAIADYLDGLGLALDVDDDDDLNALTDGLLVVRFLFGFTGEALTTGAHGLDCARCDATEIGSYLEPLTVP